MIRHVLVAVLVALLAAAPAARLRAADPGDQVTLGARLYRHGIDTSGHRIAAIAASGQPVIGAQAYCVTCHRPSGYGASEGGVFVPPITGPILFAPTKLHRYGYRFADMYKQIQPPGYANRVRDPRPRPAYTVGSLGRLLRTGHTLGGTIARTMPRYRLTERDVAALAAYLADLSKAPSPGVGAHHLQFATIFTDNVPRARRRAVVATLRAFFDWTNRNTNNDLRRPGFSPFYRSGFARSYRDWVLHVWVLHGPPLGWQAQLNADLAARPVFAEIGGIVDGPWRPVGHFCDTHRLPCLFPQTPLPSQADGIDAYSIQFSDGLFLQARVMAEFLARRAGRPVRRIRELVAPGALGAAPSAAFAAAMARARPGTKLTITTVTNPADWPHAAAVAAGPADALVIWPGQHPRAAIAALRAHPPDARLILLPASATEAAEAGLSGTLAARARVMHPTALPTAVNPESFRTRGWLAARGVRIDAPGAQFRTIYAARVLRAAVNRVVSDFYRDYLIEWVEQEAESSIDPGVYPHLSLGPGQRHASRGSYVVRLDPAAKGGIRAVGGWIVP